MWADKWRLLRSLTIMNRDRPYNEEAAGELQSRLEKIGVMVVPYYRLAATR